MPWAGLSVNRAARRIMVATLFGVARVTMARAPGIWSFDLAVMEFLDRRCVAPSSSGSTSSKSRSAALSACSARARRASSTTGWPAVMSDIDPEESALETVTLESGDNGGISVSTGEYISNGAENDMRFTDIFSSSKSVSPSGMGTVWAIRRDSSGIAKSNDCDGSWLSGRRTLRALDLLRGVGDA